MADEFDPDAFIASTTPATDAGPGARRAASGRPQEPVVAPDDVTGLDTRDVERERRMTEGNPFAGDPLARMIVTGVVGAGAGALAGAGAAAAGAGPVVTAATTGAAGGGSAAALQGGSAKDVALGAVLGGGLAALSPLMAGAAKRGAERIFKEYGQAAAGAGKGKTLAKLEKIGPDDVADVLQRNDVGSIADAQAARTATMAALAKNGQQMGAALDVIDAAPGRVTLGDAMTKLEDLRKNLAADENTRSLADALHGYMKDFWDANGGKATATIDAKVLHGKVSALEQTGYGGTAATLSPGAQKVIARKTAGVLDDLLDEHIAATAKASPAAAEAAKTLDGLTHDYRVLKTIQPIVANRAIAERFAPGVGGQALDAMAHPVRSAAKVAIGIPIRAAGATAGAIDRALAKLYAAPVVTPELAQEAIASGVAPGTLRAIMSMRSAREATP